MLLATKWSLNKKLEARLFTMIFHHSEVFASVSGSVICPSLLYFLDEFVLALQYLCPAIGLDAAI